MAEGALPERIEAIVAEHDRRMRTRAPYMLSLLVGLGLLTPLMMLRRPGADSVEMALLCFVFPGLPCFGLAFLLVRRMLASTKEVRAALVSGQVLSVTIVERTIHGIPAARVIELGRGSNAEAVLVAVAPENVERSASALLHWIRTRE